MESWPAWATEPVQLQEADRDWAVRGDEECSVLEVLLAPWLTSRIEHIGSTAVPGLPAKAIIDVQGAVADLAVADSAAAALAPHGWHFVETHLDQRPWRRLFVRVAAGRRRAHLHLMVTDSPHWEQQLRFRDALRRDPELVAAYARLKRDLAAQHEDDRESYTAGKGDFVSDVLARSRS